MILGAEGAVGGEKGFGGEARRRVIDFLVDAFDDAGERAASRQEYRQGRGQ